MGTLPSVKNILVLDSEGKRVAVKYYTDDWSSLSSKLAFEKSVFTKTMKINARNEVYARLVGITDVIFLGKRERKSLIHYSGNVGGLIPVHGTKIWYSQKLESADIVMFDGHIVIFKFIQDLHFFVTGGDDENELILASVLQDVFDAVGTILRNNVEKRTALENLDLIYLCLDEVVDGGMILETDSSVIAEKVSTASGVDTSAPFSEQTLSQAFAVAREHFARSLLK